MALERALLAEVFKAALLENLEEIRQNLSELTTSGKITQVGSYSIQAMA